MSVELAELCRLTENIREGAFMKYLPRIVDTIINEKMSTFGALLIEGP